MFRGDEIAQEQTVLGLVVSVVLKPNADAGGLDFALILPPVNLGGEAHQDFDTVRNQDSKPRPADQSCRAGTDL